MKTLMKKTILTYAMACADLQEDRKAAYLSTLKVEINDKVEK